MVGSYSAWKFRTEGKIWHTNKLVSPKKLTPLHGTKPRILESLAHGCSNHSNLEMEAEYLMKTLSYLNLNISRTKNGRNKL